MFRSIQAVVTKYAMSTIGDKIKKDVRRDFESWSGGFLPDSTAEPGEHMNPTIYVEYSLSTAYRGKVRQDILEWLLLVADEGSWDV